MSNSEPPTDTTGATVSGDVGYGKPPEATRFKPGQSGNPKGRPRNAKGRKAITRRVLLEEHRVAPPGSRRIRRCTTFELVIALLKQMAAAGDQKAFAFYEKFERRVTPHDADKPVGFLVVPEGLTREEWIARYAPKDKPPDEMDDSD